MRCGSVVRRACPGGAGEVRGRGRGRGALVGAVATQEGGMGGAGGGWAREAPALLSTALLLGGALPERPAAPLFTIDSILAPRPHPPLPPLQLQHLAHSPFHRAHDLFGTFANSLGKHPSRYFVKSQIRYLT